VADWTSYPAGAVAAFAENLSASNRIDLHAHAAIFVAIDPSRTIASWTRFEFGWRASDSHSEPAFLAKITQI
jgi:hypothetical protein